MNVVIVGAGIIGLTLARELLSRGMAERITILEKEGGLGRHASGRNSGVLHAGIYYSPDSLKAKFCIDGNRLMKAYCRQKGLLLSENGKVIVAKSERELPQLDELKRRADRAGSTARFIDTRELADIEPHAVTVERALYSPETAAIDPSQILESIGKDLEASGKVKTVFAHPFLGTAQGGRAAMTPSGAMEYDLLINAAGAFADRVAAHFGLGAEYRILPFKGTYRSLRDDRAFLVRGNIYPVPDLRNPFLGVHFSRSVHDHVHAGPTALPAFSRENYGFFENLDRETPWILFRDAILLFANPAFRAAAVSETQKYSGRVVYRHARKLVPELRLSDLVHYPKIGIRPQLVHWPTRQLVQDYVMLQGERSLHVLNAISPAFTSSMAFARHLADMIASG